MSQQTHPPHPPDDMTLPSDEIPIPPDERPLPQDDVPIQNDNPMPKENNPIPPDLQLPRPFSGNGKPLIPIPAENNPISPEMQSPPRFRDGDPQYPIPADTPISRELRLLPPLVLNRPPPPFHPCPRIIRKQQLRTWKKKIKKLKKSIISLERQLEKLNFEKAHIECCLDYFQME